MQDFNKRSIAIALALVISFGALASNVGIVAFADKGDDGVTEGTAIGNTEPVQQPAVEPEPAVEPQPTGEETTNDNSDNGNSDDVTIECIQAPCDVGTDDAATVAEAASDSNSNEVSSIVLCIASIQDSANEEFVNDVVAASEEEEGVTTAADNNSNQTAEAIDNAVEEIANNTEAQVSNETVAAVDEQASDVAEAVSDVSEAQPEVVSNETVAAVEDNANSDVVIEEIASDALANEIVEQADAQDDVNAVIGDAIVNNSDNATAAAEDIVEGVGQVADNTEVTPEDVQAAVDNVNVTEVAETVNEVANENGTSDVVVDAVVDATSDDAAVNNDAAAPAVEDNGNGNNGEGGNGVISELVQAQASIQNALDALQGSTDNNGGSVVEEPQAPVTDEQPAAQEPVLVSSDEQTKGE